MAKRENHKSHAVEIQKGPIRMDEQYASKFERQPECTLRDIQNNMMRQDMKTLTLHEPKM